MKSTSRRVRAGDVVPDELMSERDAVSLSRILRANVRKNSQDIASALAVSRHIRREFHQQLAGALTSVLNEYIAMRPQQTLAEKRALASELNAMLNSLGLAPQCPKTGLPGTLIAAERPFPIGSSRFRLDIHSPENGKQRLHSWDRLPPLAFVEDRARVEGASRVRRMQAESEKRGRK